MRAQLPERFFRLAAEDFPECDLLIVTGTSLKVQPFASLVGRVGSNVPRLLVNRERVGESEPMLDLLGLMSPGALKPNAASRSTIWFSSSRRTPTFGPDRIALFPSAKRV